MIIPSQHASRVARTAAAAAPAGDVTPNAVNWVDVSYDSGTAQYIYANQQITGITQTITLQVQIANGAGTFLYYYVSNTANTPKGTR